MKNSNRMVIGSILLGGVLLFSLYGIGNSIASGSFERDDDDHDYRNEGRVSAMQPMKQASMAAVYQEECGSCHMAYPVQLLPAESWNRIMNGLDDHFGENAELDQQTKQNLQQYLVGAAQMRQGQYRRMFRNLGSNAPLRITELPYFRNEHNEIPSRFIRGNDKVGSLSQCNSCHRNAEKGWFNEDDVVIPGVGRWDD